MTDADRKRIEGIKKYKSLADIPFLLQKIEELEKRIDAESKREFTEYHGFSAAQLNQMGYEKGYEACKRDLRAEIYEECAKIAEEEKVDADATNDKTDRVYNNACGDCAEAIRSKGKASD